MCMLQTYRRDEESNLRVVASRSVVHESCPPKPGVFRLEALPSGFSVVDADGGCELTYCGQIDSAGTTRLLGRGGVEQSLPSVLASMQNLAALLRGLPLPHHAPPRPARSGDAPPAAAATANSIWQRRDPLFWVVLWLVWTAWVWNCLIGGGR